MTKLRYSSSESLRRAVKDQLRTLAGQRSNAQLSDLLRQFAYDRFLARVFTEDPERWVLKGAAAMLARLPDAARHSKDIDLYYREVSLVEAENALRKAVALELGDYFRFTLDARRPLTRGVKATRLSVTAYLGPTEFAKFHIDMVINQLMTSKADEVSPLLNIDFGLPQPKYRAYPVVDHIADKVCAMLEMHQRDGGKPIASTRYRDLVDLATFAHSTEIDGGALTVALFSELKNRGETPPDHFPEPLGGGWTAGYARSVRDAPNLPDRDLSSALHTVRLLLNPILKSENVGRWDPTNLCWGRL